MTSSGQVIAALRQVFDPCSMAAGTPLDIVDMGLVLGVKAEADGAVTITLRPTSLMCTMIASIAQQAVACAEAVGGVTSVHVEVDGTEPWSEAAMSSRGRSALRARRERSKAEVPVGPLEWKGRRQA